VGILPYDLNLSFWSDHAIKSRWFSIPDANNTMSFDRTGNWLFPTGTVWIKHFDLELTNGVAASRRRLETRFLVKNDGGSHGFTYRWNALQTDADLVSEGGQDEAFTIYNPEGTVLRQQDWHYPSRGECLQCHTAAGGHALGFNTVQLNREKDFGDGPTNQIEVLSKLGYFDTVVNDVNTLPALSRPDETSVSLEWRVRSYLQANCVQCHQPGGGALGYWDARINTATDNAGLVNGALVDQLGDSANRVLVPGDLAHSVLLQKISIRGSGQMPPLASAFADPAGIALISEWITNALVFTNSLPVAGADVIERDPTNGVKVSVATLLGNDSDADGNPIAFVSASATSANGGIITSNNNWIFYTPPAGFTNADSFTYQITDGQGGTATGTVTVNVRSDNGPSPNLIITSLGNGSFRVRFHGTYGRTYRIQSTEDLDNPNWVSLGSATANEFGVFDFVDTLPSGSPVRFYRSIYP
jgi:mono/diheme cytochrome c family protein